MINLKRTKNNFNHPIFGGLTTIINDSNDVFFIGKEIAEILEYRDFSRLKERLDDEECLKLNNLEADTVLNGVEKTYEINSNGLFLLTESGLYSSILGSKKQEAKAFKKWVTTDVLPSIRKNGIYATDNIVEQIVNNPDLGIELLTKLKQEREAKLKAEKTVHILTHVNKTYTTTEIAKEFGFSSAILFNIFLKDKKIQFKQNETWVLYSKYADLGFVQIKQEVLDNGKIIYHRRWTGIGREFLINLVNS